MVNFLIESLMRIRVFVESGINEVFSFTCKRNAHYTI